jgi:hypothetical protein
MNVIQIVDDYCQRNYLDWMTPYYRTNDDYDLDRHPECFHSIQMDAFDQVIDKYLGYAIRIVYQDFHALLLSKDTLVESNIVDHKVEEGWIPVAVKVVEDNFVNNTVAIVLALLLHVHDMGEYFEDLLHRNFCPYYQVQSLQGLDRKSISVDSNVHLIDQKSKMVVEQMVHHSCPIHLTVHQKIA